VEGVTVRRARRSLGSKIVLTVLWVNFVALWLRVYHITSISDAFGSFLSIAGLISAYGVLVVWWIIHNLRIYRKKGPRRGARVVPFLATHDSLHRYISSRVDLRHQQEIIVDVVADRKVFIAAPAAQPEEPELTGVTGGHSQSLRDSRSRS
jgi:hypothetical protein